MKPVIEFKDVSVTKSGQKILGPLSFSIEESQRWVIVGPNGAGKTTTLNLMAAADHPSSGEVHVLGEQLGKVDVFELRTRIGLTTHSLISSIPEDETVLDVVMSASYAILGRWQESYDLWDESRALSLLTILGIRDLRDRIFSTLSEGEKKRTLIGRALMPNPELLLLDEPASALDLAGREDILKRLDQLALDPSSPATVIVTHHLEEIPPGTTHALLLKSGLAIAAGEINQVLTEHNLKIAFGIDISLIQTEGRFFAKAK